MIIKEIHDFPDQVFGGGGWRDALKEFGNNCRVVKLDDTAYIIQRGDGKKSWTITTYFTNLAGTEGVVVVYMLSGESVVKLEGVTLYWEVSPGVMMLVLGANVSSMMGEVMVGWEILLGVALAEDIFYFGEGSHSGV